MKTKRVLSILLAACLLLSLVPAVTLLARSATNPDPVYSRVGTPEVAIFNAYTGASSDFFKSEMSKPFYNAVEQAEFRKTDDETCVLGYETKISADSTYVWKRFYDSKLAYLSDKYQQLQVGYAVTRTSNSHTHRWKLIYSADLTSYMNTDLYLNDEAHGQYWGLVRYTGFSNSASTLRQGNGVFHGLGYTINGSNSRYLTISGVDQRPIRRKMYLSFVNSSLYYDGQKKTCSCGGSATGATVSFYDGVAPKIQSVEIKKGDSACANFKAGDLVTVVLNCSEAIRFADDSKAGKGDVYIGLTVEGATDRLPAHLVRLENESLTFTYQIPASDTKLYTITGIDLTSAPVGGTALVHSSEDITLKQIYGGSGNKTYNAKKPASVSSELGFSKTTCYVTDMAGNALVGKVPPESFPFYIDCESPYVALAGLSANTNNGAVKAALGKTDLAPASSNYEDNSDLYLGVGDSFSLTLYLNEIVTGSDATVTTNVKQADGSYLTLHVSSSGTTAANGIGSQYGKGASKGYLSVLYTDPVTVASGMTVDGAGGIQITDVRFTAVCDASGNNAAGAAKSPDKKYYIDTAAPIAATQPAVQAGGVNRSFYLPFTVTDAASGVAGLPASLTVKSGDSTAKFQYAITNSAGAPAAWADGALGTSLSFTQTSAQQYLHVKPVDGESYNFGQTAAVIFTLADYAGNSGTSAATLSGVALDSVAPTATALRSERSFANGAGALTVTFHAQDAGGLRTVQYQWTDPAATEPTGAWSNAPGNLDGNPAEAELTAEASVPNNQSFCKSLWIKATDVAGNTGTLNLGEFSYDLSAIQYGLEYPSGVSKQAEICLKSLQTGGRLLIELKKTDDSDSYFLYLDTSSPYLPTAQNPQLLNLLSTHIGNWNESGRDTLRYDWWKGSTQVSGDTTTVTFTERMDTLYPYLYGYTGNVSVTVHSGGEMLISAGTNGASQHTVSVKDGAGAEQFLLCLSPAGNTIADVFDNETVFTADAQTLARLGGHVQAYPWSFDASDRVCSTLEGVQLRIDLGGDKNGWDYADVDWQNSFIALYPANYPAPDSLDALRADKLCAIASGPSQTVTLPAGDYASGYYSLALVLQRRSDPDGCYAAVLNDGTEDTTVYIDATQPGSLSLGVLAKQLSGYDGVYEQIVYDPDAPIYIPTEGYDVMLSVEALDKDGQTIDFTYGNGAYIYAGAVDVVAWHTAAPETKISLSHAHLTSEDFGIWMDQARNDYPTNGKRLLQFGTETVGVSGGFPSGILGLTPDQDNVIALQVLYANGSASAVRYLTVHPVTMQLTGDVSTSPAVDESVYGPFSEYTTSGLVTAGPGSASVSFTPDSGSNTAGVRLYCQEGYAYLSGGETRYAMYGGYGEELGEMLPESDGSYRYQLPAADAEEYAAAYAAFADDPDNNPYPGRYIGIFEPTDEGCRNIIQEGGQPAGYYIVYAKDAYGNLRILGITKNGILADSSAPIVSGSSLVAADGAYTATFTVRDDSLFAFGRDSAWNDTAMSRPMTLQLFYDEGYAAAIGATGESLTLTADAAGGSYVWKADSANKLGVSEVSATLTRSGSFEGWDSMTTYFHGAEDVVLTVTVKGVVSPGITSATDMTLNLSVTDAHGNRAEAVGLTASVTGVQPQITAMEYMPVQLTPGISDLALLVRFNQPVQPLESWINRSISGYATEWQDAFPITNDGVWELSFTDLFGTLYTLSVDTADYKGANDSVFGVYGFDLDLSTLDFVPASEGVTITASYTGTDGDCLHIWKGDEALTPNDGDDRLTNRVVKAKANGDYTLYLYGESGWTEKLHIYLENIVSGGPDVTLYLYLDEFKEQYVAGSPEQFTGTTAGSVTVSYRTSRTTSPVGDTALTFRSGDSDTFTFQYYDVPTDFTYTISGKLSDYGITLTEPETPYEDKDAPSVDLVTVWTQRGGGFVQADAFPGSADEAGIHSAIENAGTAQSYDFVVNASDYSKWKLVVKSAAPSAMSFAAATSDAIPGVSVSGNNVLVTKDVASDFWIVAVDNATADSASTADNFSCIHVPFGSYRFDTVAPNIVTATVANGLYAKTVYIKATDEDDSGNDTSLGVTISGAGVIRNTDAGYLDYPCKLVFSDNDTVVVITATDAAGNSAVANIQVAGIDASAPVLSVTWSPCFRDPTDGSLNAESPTAGPVNTDVVALISSDKEIASVRVDGYFLLGPEQPEYTDWYGNPVITYSSQRLNVLFTDEWETSYQLEVFAPNGKSTTLTVTLGDRVIDKTPPLVGDIWNYLSTEDLTRDGYSTAYAVRCSLFDPFEDVYCMNSGTAGVAYNASNPFVFDLRENESLSYLFSDKAGNLTEVTIPAPPATYLDSLAPEIELSGLDDDASATSGSVSFTVTVRDETEITLTANDDSVVCGALTQGTDSNGNTVWTAGVDAASNGTFRLTATDLAGNSTQVSFTVNNIDKSLPVISFDSTTVSLRQDSDAAALAVLLDAGSGSVHVWDNVAIREHSLVYDASGVDLSRTGIYPVVYSVEDTAGNVGQATRYVRVVDKHQLSVSVDGVLTEQNGVLNLAPGTHTLTVSGLKTPNEPYTVQLVRGIWSAGQMKRASGGIPVGDDGKFTVAASGFYTLYITTQSRQSYRLLLYVEN